MVLRVAVLTVSDRSASGERPDEAGPTIVELIQAEGWLVTRRDIVPDDSGILREKLVTWVDNDVADIILTTGGTGFAPRDVTPEATLAIIDREAPGLAEAMRAASATRSPHAMLSRARAGIRGKVLIVNLPGSPKGALENLKVVMPALGHAVQLLRDEPGAEGGHGKAVV
jgi:molybdenum cofactor synthesis domain-containing protein